MISVFAKDATDFTGNGLGLLLPTRCDVDEILNNKFELVLEHPIDKWGKWTRLVDGNILRVPVPTAMTPQVNLAEHLTPGQSVQIWKVHTSGARLQLRNKPSFDGTVIGYYSSGSEVIYQGTSGSWAEVLTSDGKHGYMHTDNVSPYRTVQTMQQAAGEVIPAREMRDQPFRIYKVIIGIDSVTVHARHLMYDLIDNIIHKLGITISSSVTGAQVLQAMFVIDMTSGQGLGCVMPHNFTAHSDLTSTADKFDLLDRNPVDALLGSEGFASVYGGELARDWYDVYMVSRVGVDTQIEIREGKNLKSVKYDVDTTGVKTRLVPVGETKNGNPLYLPWSVDPAHPVYPWMDSLLHIDDYFQPKVYYFRVPDAKESNEKTVAQCWDIMERACVSLIAQGCDLPKVSLEVDFVNLTDVEEYKKYEQLQSIHIGDQITVITKKTGIRVPIRMTQYTFDALTKRYKHMVLGTPELGLSGISFSAAQLSAGSVNSSVIATNGVSAGNLADASVTVRHLTADSVSADAIQAGSVLADKIAAGAVTADKIDAGVGGALDISANASITLTAGQLSNLAAQIQVMNGAISRLVTQVNGQGTTLSTAISQNSTQITAAVTRMAEIAQDGGATAGNLEELRELIETYLTFSEDGLKIGKSGNPFTFRVDERQLGFYVNDSLVAYMQNDKLHIEYAEINRLRLKDYGIEEPDETGNLTFYYYGSDVNA